MEDDEKQQHQSISRSGILVTGRSVRVEASSSSSCSQSIMTWTETFHALAVAVSGLVGGRERHSGQAATAYGASAGGSGLSGGVANALGNRPAVWGEGDKARLRLRGTDPNSQAGRQGSVEECVCKYLSGHIWRERVHAARGQHAWARDGPTTGTGLDCWLTRPERRQTHSAIRQSHESERCLLPREGMLPKGA